MGNPRTIAGRQFPGTEGSIWIWPFRVPSRIGRDALGAALWLAYRCRPWRTRLVWAVAIGALPPLASILLGWRLEHFLTAVLVTPFVAAAASTDDFRMAGSVLGTVFLVHSAIILAYAMLDPAGLMAIFPDGAAYGRESYDWIRHGITAEKNVRDWLPADLLLIGGMAIFTYTSFGLITVWQGLYEVDLMNAFVGRLLDDTSAPLTALTLGWHPWSVCRGIGCLFVAFEVVSWSLGRLTGTSLSTPSRHLTRCGLAAAFLGADVILKFTGFDFIRASLARILI